MANSLLTPRALRDVAVLTMRQGRNPKWDNIALTTGWSIDFDGPYCVMTAYDEDNGEQWRHLFKGGEWQTIVVGSLESFSAHLVEKWPDVFAPAPEPELKVQVLKLSMEVSLARSALETAIRAYDVKFKELDELLGKL
jgi:hypothetical protein